MGDLERLIAASADANDFSGVVRVDVDGVRQVDAAFGFADRAFAVANAVDTRFATASVTKGFTALTVLALVELGALQLGTTARSLLGEDLPEIADDVTVEHLLAHRSGIGDYLDEDELESANDYVLDVPVHQLVTADDYLGALGGRQTAFPAGSSFAYNNSGYVVLALLAERATGVGYHDLVQRHVFDPARMTRTAFLRSDELPADAARGYLSPDGLRTNVLHLPVVGVGDGGAYSTVGDMHRFWSALTADRIVSAETRSLMTTPHSVLGEGPHGYGLGFWLRSDVDAVALVGGDPGISCLSRHVPDRGLTYTMLSNQTDDEGRMASDINSHLGI